jgi:hypothetical protein
MKIYGFDSALPPPDKGKGQKQDSQVGNQNRIDRIELSSGQKPEVSYTAKLSRRGELANYGSRIEHPAFHLSRLHPHTQINITGRHRIADMQSYPHVEQPYADRIESPSSSGPIDSPADDGRAGKLAEVRLKIAAGYYNNPEHLEKLADRLIDGLNIGNAKESDDVSHNR